MSGRRVAVGIAQTVVVAAIMLFAMTIYWLAANYPPRPPVPTRTDFDNLVPLWPAFAYVYVSPYIVGPALAGLLSWTVFRRMLLRAALLLPLQLGAYFALPTTVLRPEPPVGDAFGAELLRNIYLVDTPSANAAPSGHVSLAFVIAWAAWVSLPRARALSVLYFALVCFSILFTGQHHVVDLVTGAMLGGFVLVLAALRERARAPGAPG